MAGVRCRSGCVPSGYPQPPCPWPLSCEHSCRCHFSETNVSLLAYLFLVAFQLEAGLLQQFSGRNKRCGFVNSPPISTIYKSERGTENPKQAELCLSLAAASVLGEDCCAVPFLPAPGTHRNPHPGSQNVSPFLNFTRNPFSLSFTWSQLLGIKFLRAQ